MGSFLVRRGLADSSSTMMVFVIEALRDHSVWPNKTLSYRRRTARRAMSVEILSTAALLYTKNHSWKNLQQAIKANYLEGHTRGSSYSNYRL